MMNISTQSITILADDKKILLNLAREFEREYESHIKSDKTAGLIVKALKELGSYDYELASTSSRAKEEINNTIGFLLNVKEDGGVVEKALWRKLTNSDNPTINNTLYNIKETLKGHRNTEVSVSEHETYSTTNPRSARRQPSIPPRLKKEIAGVWADVPRAAKVIGGLAAGVTVLGLTVDQFIPKPPLPKQSPTTSVLALEGYNQAQTQGVLNINAEVQSMYDKDVKHIGSGTTLNSNEETTYENAKSYYASDDMDNFAATLKGMDNNFNGSAQKVIGRLMYHSGFRLGLNMGEGREGENLAFDILKFYPEAAKTKLQVNGTDVTLETFFKNGYIANVVDVDQNRQEYPEGNIAAWSSAKLIELESAISDAKKKLPKGYTVSSTYPNSTSYTR